MLLIRPTRLIGDFIKCPYCRVTLHADKWLDQEYINYDNSLKNIQ